MEKTSTFDALGNILFSNSNVPSWVALTVRQFGSWAVGPLFNNFIF